MYKILFILCWIPFFCNAQIVINEVMSDNENILEDNFGETSDWIELYNSSSETIELEGFYLSDGADNLERWQFPSQEIAGNGFLLIFASDNNLEEPVLHTNFKLSSNGEGLYLSDAQGTIVDFIEIPPLDNDISYGRQTDGADNWVYFDAPSPANSNDGSSFFAFAQAPVFTNTSYFNNSPVQIEITCSEPNCTIYYTTDGSQPDENSIRYTAPISIQKTTCFQAISVAEGLENSVVSTQTYFVGVDNSIPIVALTVDSLLLHDEENGVFSPGPDASSEWPFWGANFWKNIELPAHFEFYEPNGAKAYAHNVGMKVHGGRGSRTNPLKSIRFLAKDDYGIESMDYKFFPNREREHYRRIVLRNASGDFNWTYMRDAFMNNLVIHEKFDVDCLAARAVLWYINGEFWGLMYLREKSDEYYLQNNWGVDIDNLDLLEEDTLVVLGDYEHFDNFYAFARNNDLSIESNFQTAAQQFDVNSLADYFIIETLSNNTDWPTNNIKFWREKKEGSKWRYILFDLDVALGARSWTDPEVDSFGDKMVQYQDTNRHVNILHAFLEDEDYQHYFINRYADIINTSFEPEYLQAKVDSFVAVIEPFMAQHLDKWQNQTYEEWQNEKLPEINFFVENRPMYARQFLQDYFELENQVKLNLSVFPPEAGRIKINTIVPKKLPWQGVYYNGVPVELSIVPNPGFEFDYWQSLHTISNPNTNPVIVQNFEQDDAITAYFKTENTFALQAKVFPNPSFDNDKLTCQFILNQISNVSYSIYNTIGKEILAEENIRLNAGVQQIELNLPSALASGVYFLDLNIDNQEETVRFMVL